MTLIGNVPTKTYRLCDGSFGTEFDAMKERLGVLLARKQMIEDAIELTRIQMLAAAGATL